MCESDFRKLAFRKLLSCRNTLCDSTQWAALLRTGFATSCPYRMFALHHRQSMEITNGEGGIWTLAPLLTTYSLSRGAPSASWVLLHKSWLMIQYIRFVERVSPAERVGFEPTRPFGQTVFKTASLWPLRYLSAFIKLLLCISDKIDNTIVTYHCQHFFTTFLNFFFTTFLNFFF